MSRRCWLTLSKTRISAVTFSDGLPVPVLIRLSSLSAAALLLSTAFFAVGCGKVGDPLPPFIRIPETTSDFRVVQVAYDLQFQWTNPLRNLDQSTSTDLARAVLRADEEILANIEVTAAGELQAYQIPGADLIGVERIYTIQFETSSRRSSDISAPVRLSVVEVPGRGPSPAVAIDQGRVRISWEPPAEGARFVDGYRVYRSDVLISPSSLETRSFDDMTFVEGERYIYAVVAVRRVDDKIVEGVRFPPLEVTVVDSTPPAVPQGIEIVPINDGAFIRWQRSAEADIARYRVYRRVGEGAQFVPIDDGRQTTTAFSDNEYRPGFEYAVSGVDQAGNEGPMSQAVTEP